MNEIVMNYKDNNNQTKFITLFMKKINIRVNDMVKLLDVTPNTIYNYRTMDDDDIPQKIKEKLFSVLEVDNYQDARKVLISITDEKRSQIAKSMGSLLKTTLIVDTNYGNNKKDSIDEEYSFLEDALGSKVYVNALLFEIKKVVKSKDDYDFISYVRKYNTKL